jgi:hypothetical protein
MFEIVNILVSRKAQKKWSGYTATPESRAYLFGVERRCRLTDTFLPLLTVLVYGLTGTIFFPALVLLIACRITDLQHASPVYSLRCCGVKTSPNLRGIFNFLKDLTIFNNLFCIYSKICRIFAVSFGSGIFEYCDYVAYFVATKTAGNAGKDRLSILNKFAAYTIPVNVTSKTGKGSLSSFINFKISSC